MPAVGAGSEIAVTGANGFIGSHICKTLLADGFRVRAVVRNPSDPAKVGHLVSLPGAGERLRCVNGDLIKPGGYDEAFAGVDAVVHCAAVVELASKDPENEIVRPAVEGTKNVIAAVKKAGVKRLVMTSSVAAVHSSWGLPDSHIYTEADWNGWSTIQTDPYGYAKTQQERVLWKELSGDAAGLDAVSINPSMVIGPALAKSHTRSSLVFVRQTVYGNASPNFNTTFVDVRDVAASCSAALTVQAAGGKRFLCAGNEGVVGALDLNPIAQKQFPQYVLGARPQLNPWLIWPLARLGFINSFQESMLRRKFPYSNERMKSVLGVRPRPLPETVKDSIESMTQTGWVKPRKAKL